MLVPAKLLRFAVLRVFLAAFAILVELQPVGIVTAILFGGVVSLFTVVTL